MKRRNILKMLCVLLACVFLSGCGGAVVQSEADESEDADDGK